jgi:3-oxoacyl-[acyl-carrier protein] reductase
MVFRVGFQFYFVPKALQGARLKRSPVKIGPPVDELDLKVGPSRGAALGPPPGLRIAIAGASSGIGEALARALGGEGHTVFICGRRHERLIEIARQVPSLHAVACDITDESQVAGFAAAIAAELDGLDALINCVGAFGEIGPATGADSSLWWDTVRLNLFGPYLTIKHCVPLLENGTKPRIINLSGGGAFGPFPNYSAYACSKAALVRLTECLAVELQPQNIRVNSISPGVIATDIHNATLAAGEQRAGRLQYRRAISIMSDGKPSMNGVIDCVGAMLSPGFDRLTGKTISCNFDPWQTEAFLAHIEDITASDLYTLRRLNAANLNEGYLRKTLSQAWAGFGSRS